MRRQIQTVGRGQSTCSKRLRVLGQDLLQGPATRRQKAAEIWLEPLQYRVGGSGGSY